EFNDSNVSEESKAEDQSEDKEEGSAEAASQAQSTGDCCWASENKKNTKTERSWGAAVWGLVIIFIGFLFLGQSLHWFNFYFWSSIWRFWPFILLFVGVNMIPVKSWFKATLNILLLLALFALLIFNGTNCKGENWHSTEGVCMDHTMGIFEDSVLFEMEVEPTDSLFAQLNIEAGACSFDGFWPCVNLADVKNGTHSETEQCLRVNKELNKTKYKINSLEPLEIKAYLNMDRIWDMEMNVGAGSTNLDLSKYKLRNLTFNGGVSSVVVTLGALYPHTNIDFQSGVSSIEIRVPKEVGVCINSTTVLSAHDMEGLHKQNGAYYSDNFLKAASKVYINQEGALSTFTFTRVN
ncbi:MAG: DUF5668 domain-containing protein, partial [Bacteroidales bacterium]